MKEDHSGYSWAESEWAQKELEAYTIISNGSTEDQADLSLIYEDLISQKRLKEAQKFTINKIAEPRPHPFINKLKWATGIIIPSTIALSEAIQYHFTGINPTINYTTTAFMTDISIFMGLVITTPDDMGKSTVDFLKNRITKPVLALYQRPIRTSL